MVTDLKKFAGVFLLYLVTIGAVMALFVFLGAISDSISPDSLNPLYLNQGVLLAFIAVRILAIAVGFYIALIAYGLPFLQIAEIDIRRFVTGVVVISIANIIIFFPIANNLLLEAAINLGINMMVFYVALDLYGSISNIGPSVPLRRHAHRRGGTGK